MEIMKLSDPVQTNFPTFIKCHFKFFFYFISCSLFFCYFYFRWMLKSFLLMMIQLPGPNEIHELVFFTLFQTTTITTANKHHRFIFFCMSSPVNRGDLDETLHDDFYSTNHCNGTHFIVIKWSRDFNGFFFCFVLIFFVVLCLRAFVVIPSMFSPWHFTCIIIIIIS